MTKPSLKLLFSPVIGIKNFLSLTFIIIICGTIIQSCKGTQEKSKKTDEETDGFIKVLDNRFVLKGKPYYFLGANFWIGMNLGSSGDGGNRERLIRELDRLQKLGITNLRIMALSEGPDTEPYRMVPSSQSSPGIFNEQVLEGLDFLLAEMAKRKMYAVVCLTNFWPWSGGMSQYISWATNEPIPYPMAPNGDWDKFQKYTARFYSMPKAKEMYKNAITTIINRVNKFTNKPYKNDPTIMAWELCNEPRGLNNIQDYLSWIDSTSTYIKSIDTNHLVTIGSEGYTAYRDYAGVEFDKAHAFKNIDYTCAHIWIQNWEWYDPKKHEKTFENAKQKALSYLREHATISKKLGKPFVLEEFGIMRDNGSYEVKASTQNRDLYYTIIFEEVYKLALDSSKASGVAFWAWAGEGRPRVPKCWWKPGDDFTGDPPHEEQGWYSVYDIDTSTHRVIANFASKFNELGK
jgi:mannan endo-1,4-beta-mannosidase